MSRIIAAPTVIERAVNRRRQTVTIRHVAADAGVSLQTVSRVINNEPNVRPEMTRRVQESIDRLNYVPSLAAQRMRGSRSRLIMALNDRDRTIEDWRRRDGSNWIDQMLLGGMLTAARHGYRMIVELVDTHNSQIETELLAAIAALQPDGVVLTPPHSQDRTIIDLLSRQHIRIARIGSLAPGPGFLLTMDDEGAARLATEHLLDLGHRRIGFIAGSAAYELSEWRVTGWRGAMEQAGLCTEGLLGRGDFSRESGRACAAVLLDQDDPPTAIVASNDLMTLATLELAQERGMDVPRDLSLISFDDTPIVRFTQPSLTAIVQPIAEIVEQAVEAIVRMERDGSCDDTPLLLHCTLVDRGSTAAVAL